MNYDDELRKYFSTAWRDYLRRNPGANQQSWYASNAVNLKKYFDALWQQKQAAAAKPPAPAPAPATPRPAPMAAPPTQSQAQQPTSQELIAINQAIQNIMAHQGVDRATAERIFQGITPRPSDGAYVPQNPTGMPIGQVKPGLDWKQYDELVRSNKEAEALARNRLAYDKGVSIGKVDGTNTLESVDYANQVLSNPQNAALAEQIRKGYALGDLPGQTVASYLTRSVDKPTAMPGHAYGGTVMGYLGGGIPGFANGLAQLAEVSAGMTPQQQANFWAKMQQINQLNTVLQNAGEGTVQRYAKMANPDNNPDFATRLFQPSQSFYGDKMKAPLPKFKHVSALPPEVIRNFLNYLQLNTNTADPTDYTLGMAHGGGVVVGDEPHWIVDNEGKPVAALSEDGKHEAVQGTKNGIEVIPLDPMRNMMYNHAKNNVPGMAFGGIKGIGKSFQGRRTAPSRRLGSQNNAQSRNRTSLPGDMSARKNDMVADGRMNNGTVNNGRPSMMPVMPGNRDKDAMSILPAAKNLWSKIRERGPVPVNVNIGDDQVLMDGFARTRALPTTPFNDQRILPTTPYTPVPVYNNDLSAQPIAPFVPVRGAAFGMSPTFIASGGNRVIGDNVGAPKFGFAADAPSDIAGRNVLSGVKNTPGVFVRAAHKFQPRTFRTMNSADRALLESYVRATGGDPAAFWEQAGFAEPQSATSRRQFY